MKKTYILVDCSHVCYAAFFSLPRLSSKDTNTGVIFGFLKRVLDITKALNTNRVIFCWDSPASLRKDKYSWYKERRAKKHRENGGEEAKILFAQMEILRNVVLPMIGFKNQVLIEGFEADDVIAKLVESRSSNFYVVTNDSDMYQILKNKNCLGIYKSHKKQLYDVKKFKEEHLGLSPKKWHLVKAIAGCETDEVPGCPRVGEKTAVKYLTGNLPETHKTYDMIISKEGRKIKKRNLWLVTLPLPETPEIKIFKDKFTKKGFLKVCRMYGFISLENNRHAWYKMMGV